MSWTIRQKTQDGKRVHRKVDRRWMIDTIKQQQEVINQLAELYFHLKQTPGSSPTIRDPKDIPLIIPVSNTQAIADISRSREDV